MTLKYVDADGTVYDAGLFGDPAVEPEVITEADVHPSQWDDAPGGPPNGVTLEIQSGVLGQAAVL